MEVIRLHDLNFRIYIEEAAIHSRITELANLINKDLKGERPLFIGILNGAFMFSSDLMKEVRIHCEITFVKLASYQGTSSTGSVKTLVGMDKNLSGRTVVIVEDIVDTGKTLHEFFPVLKSFNPERVLIASLLFKRLSFQYDFTIDYTGFEVPDEFLVGYGLDYDGLGRNLKEIYVQC